MIIKFNKLMNRIFFTVLSQILNSEKSSIMIRRRVKSGVANERKIGEFHYSFIYNNKKNTAVESSVQKC